MSFSGNTSPQPPTRKTDPALKYGRAKCRGRIKCRGEGLNGTESDAEYSQLQLQYVTFFSPQLHNFHFLDIPSV